MTWLDTSPITPYIQTAIGLLFFFVPCIVFKIEPPKIEPRQIPKNLPNPKPLNSNKAEENNMCGEWTAVKVVGGNEMEYEWNDPRLYKKETI